MKFPKRKKTPSPSNSDLESSPSNKSTSARVTFPPKPIIVVEEEEDKHDDVIPGPDSLANGTKEKSYDELRISATEHYKRGDGILASIKDIGMPPEEFAAGCNLLQAAAMGNLGTMQVLLEKNPSHVDFRDYDRRTALHVAASEGHLNICQYLVEKKGARINRSDRWGGSPLDDAHRHRHEDVVVFLRQHGATTGSSDRTTNLVTAAAEGDVNEVKLLLKVMTLSVINGGDYDGRTALHLAAGEGHANIVRLLLEDGHADPNTQDRWGGRPLDDALRNNQNECASLLQQHGGQLGRSSTRGRHFGSKHSSSGSHILDNSGSIRKREKDNLMINFDDLEMIERIGAGAFGEIYKCKWRGTLVAAKCIKTAKIRRNWLMEQALSKSGRGINEDALDELEDMSVSQHEKDLAIADFRQETAILRSLRHPNICLLLAYSTTADYEVMISELMKCSLLDVFKANLLHGRRLPKKTQIVYAQQLAQGMNYLHTCKPPVIHRDLKPANLLIDPSGVLKVADFGLAKVRPDPKPGSSEDGGPVDFFAMTGETGSYRFMAPEVYRRQYYNETVDIYSYAMIFYYLLNGKPPWPSLAGHKAVAKAVDGERPPIPRDWDDRLSTLLKQCWDESPQNRPPFSKILTRLEDYCREVLKIDQRRASKAIVAPPGTPDDERMGCRCVIL